MSVLARRGPGIHPVAGSEQAEHVPGEGSDAPARQVRHMEAMVYSQLGIGGVAGPILVLLVAAAIIVYHWRRDGPPGTSE